MLPVGLIEKILHCQTSTKILVDVPAKADVHRRPPGRAIRVDPGIDSVSIAQAILTSGEPHEGLDPEAGQWTVKKADLPVQGGDPIGRRGPAVASLPAPGLFQPVQVVTEPLIS